MTRWRWLDFSTRRSSRLKDYYVDVETTGELTAGETLGYSPVPAT